MMLKRILELLFNGKKPVPVGPATINPDVQPQRIELARQLKEIDRSYKKIEVEGKRMKKKIDTALAIALSTMEVKHRGTS